MNRLEEPRRRTSEAATSEKTKMLSEPWLLTRTLKLPVGLGHHVDRAGQGRSPPLACKTDATRQAVALRLQQIDAAVGEGHHDLPARQRPARPRPAGRR